MCIPISVRDNRDKSQVISVGSLQDLQWISVVASYIGYGLSMKKYPTCFGVTMKLIPVIPQSYEDLILIVYLIWSLRPLGYSLTGLKSL